MTRHLNLHPEWDPIAEHWVGWPSLEEEWDIGLAAPRAEIADFIALASQSVDVKVLTGTAEGAISAARATGGTGAEILTFPDCDIWLRDTGPIFTGRGEMAHANVFRFNGWGGKFEIPGDRDVSRFITHHSDLPMSQHDFILEGGSIDFDGAGHLLTTRQCLLNANRNPDLSQKDIEAKIKEALGPLEFIWLDDGLVGDHTDGHIDNLARFIGPGHVVCQRPSGPDDPNTTLYTEVEAALRKTGLKVSTMPSPGRLLDGAGDPLPASHMNFVFLNGVILMPIYDERYGQTAQQELSVLLPGWEVKTLPARAILSGGGAFHCMTCQVPKALYVSDL